MLEHECIETLISNFMMRFAKFEFFLVNLDSSLARKTFSEAAKIHYIEGVDWTRLSNTIEDRFPFSSFKFEESGFGVFRTASPQRLALKDTGRLGWDDEPIKITSWELLTTKGVTRLRNNIAHGNKAQLIAPFTEERTEHFILAGHSFIDFVTTNVFEVPDWEHPIFFG